MMINGFNNIKDDIRDVRHEIKENNFYIYNKIDELNNRYIQQTNKFNDELRNQDKKIIENEVIINEHERTLNELITSNVKQNVKINEHEVMLIRQQDSLMLCIDNVKKLYQEANEIRNDLLEKNEMIKNIALKNEEEISDIRIKCNEGLEKINEITQVLNKHTEILTEHSTAIAKLQAISFRNSEKINEICEIMFNHESRIKSLEGRVDKIEEILKKHEEAIINLTGDVSEMKDKMKEIMDRIKKIEAKIEKMEMERIQEKTNSILDIINNMKENELYEFAEFILYLRKMNDPFNLDSIIKGLKFLKEKK
jgi:methyl-accepting chemotaxis protein